MRDLTKKEAIKFHLFLVLVLKHLSDKEDYDDYVNYYKLNVSPTDNHLPKREHIRAIVELRKLILDKIDYSEYCHLL